MSVSTFCKYSTVCVSVMATEPRSGGGKPGLNRWRDDSSARRRRGAVVQLVVNRDRHGIAAFLGVRMSALHLEYVPPDVHKVAGTAEDVGLARMHAGADGAV